MTDTTAGEGVKVRDDLTEAEALTWFQRTGMTPAEIVKALAAQPSAGAQGEAVAWRYRVDASCPWSLAFHEPEPGLFEWQALGIIPPATPAQPDTGDVEALLALFGDDSELMVVERSAPSLEISTDSLRSEILAALSKPNAQGREG